MDACLAGTYICTYSTYAPAATPSHLLLAMTAAPCTLLAILITPSYQPPIIQMDL